MRRQDCGLKSGDGGRVRLWNSRVERVVRGVEMGGARETPERRVAWVDWRRLFGFGRWAEGGMEMIRDVAEQRGEMVARRDRRGRRRSNILSN